MKIIFFSDIHGNKYALSSFLKELKKIKPEIVVFCGDVFGYYYYQNEIIDCFRKNEFVTLLGNHDQYFLDLLCGNMESEYLISRYGNSYKNIQEKITDENIEFLKTLKPKYEIEADGYKIGVFHGSPSNHLNGRIYPDTEINETADYALYDYVILGHTHHKMERELETTIILNPGSIGQQRDGKGCSYLVLDTKTREYEFKLIEFEIERLINDIDYYDQGNVKLKEVLFRKANEKKY